MKTSESVNADLEQANPATANNAAASASDGSVNSPNCNSRPQCVSNTASAVPTTPTHANMAPCSSVTTCSCAASPQRDRATSTATASPATNTGLPASLDNMVTLTIAPTTGGQFELQVTKSDCIEHLKKCISKRLKVPKERICLLFRDRQLRDGTLRENGVADGSRITLLPSVETGLLTQRPEQSVMQALESLSDGQVNDFLSGKAPLNLTMRLGDHMMLIQLQLSAVAPHSSTHRRSSSSRPSPAATTTPGTTTAPLTTSPTSSSALGTGLSAMLNAPANSRQTSSLPTAAVSRSPSPLLAAELSKPATTMGTPASTASSAATHNLPRPVVNKPATGAPSNPSRMVPSDTPTPLSFSSNSSSSSTSSAASLSSTSSPSISSSSSSTSCFTEECKGCDHCGDENKPLLDTRALAEASRNLTQTLKQLSSEVLTCRSGTSSSESRRRRQGAIIESMHHHGKGVYSGTFSGTLNPALQDKNGRPKRDISTIIHILNDLLCATPQYRRHLQSVSTGPLPSAAGTPASSSPSSSFTATANSTASSSSSPILNDVLGCSNSKTPSASTATTSQSLPTAASSTSAPSSYKSAGKANTALPPFSFRAPLQPREEVSRMSEENQATRGKLEQLRMVMEERRARRRARREARVSPYAWSGSAKAEPAGDAAATAAILHPTASTTLGDVPCSEDTPMDTSDAPGASAATDVARELNAEAVVA